MIERWKSSSSDSIRPRFIFENECSPPRTFLLRRSPRGNHGGGAQYSLWHPAARGERTGGAVGGVSWCHAVSAPAICPHTRGRKTVPVHSTVLFKSGSRCHGVAGGEGPANPHWRLDHRTARSFAGIVSECSQEVSDPENRLARSLPSGIGESSGKGRTGLGRHIDREKIRAGHPLAGAAGAAARAAGRKKQQDYRTRAAVEARQNRRAAHLLAECRGDLQTFPAGPRQAGSGLVSQHRSQFGGPHRNVRGEWLWHRGIRTGAQSEHVPERASAAAAGFCAGNYGRIVAGEDLGAAA